MDEDILDLNTSDPLYLMISELFGYGKDTSALANVLTNFNGAILIVAGLILAYIMIAGTLQTAHDGEMLGKKWSSVWMPIRTALGIGILFPMANGLNAIQSMVLWAVFSGMGFANNLWASFNTDINYSYTSISRQAEIKDLAINMLKSNVCIEAMKKGYVGDGYEGFDIAYGNNKKDGLLDYSIKYGNSTNSACGSVVLSKITNENENTSGLLQKVDYDFEKLFEIRQANINELAKLDNELNLIAKEIVSKDDKFLGLDKKLDLLVSNYSSKVNEKAKTVFDSLKSSQELHEEISKSFIYAGSFFMRMNAVKQSVNGMALQVPSYTGIDPNITISDARKYTPWIDNELKSTNNRVMAENFNQNIEANKNDSGFFKKTIDKVLGFISSDLSENLYRVDNEQNLIAQAQDISSKLEVNSSVIIATGAAVSIVSSALGSMILTIGMGLMGFSGFLGTIIPMMPYVIWLMAVIGFLVLVVEAVLGASFLALSLLVGGDEHLGGAKKGIQLMVNVVFRPALMVLGLIFAILCLDIVSSLFNMTFAVAFNSAASTSIISSVFGLFLYVSVLVSLCYKLFGLINDVPNRVLTWFGNYVDHGFINENAEKHSNTNIVGSVSSNSRNVGSSVGQGLGNLKNQKMPKPKDK